MRTFGLLIFILLSFLNAGFAQIDSLQNLLKVYAKKPENFINDTSKVYFLNEISYHYRNSNADSTLFYGEKSLKLAQAIDWQKGVARAYQRIGVAHRVKGNYPFSIDYFLKSLKIFESLSDSRNIAGTFNLLGLIYQKQQHYKTALAYFKKAIPIEQHYQNTRGLVTAYNNIGLTYFRMRNFSEALKYYLIAEPLCKKLNDKLWFGINYRNLGEVYLALGEIDKAEKYAQAGLKYSEEIGNKIGIISTKNVLARILQQKKKYSEAISTAHQSIQIAKSLGGLEYMKDAYFILYENYKALGNQHEALLAYEQYIEHRDSLFNEENNQVINNLETTYENEQRKKDQILQMQRVRFQRLFTYSLAVGFVLVLSIAFILFYNNRQKLHINQLLVQQKYEITAQNEELQSQNELLEEVNREKDGLVDIVAHDLRTPLNQIKGLVHLVETNQTNADQQNYLKLMYRVCENGITLIRDLLDLNQIKHPESEIHLTEINLSDFIHDLLTQYQAQASEKEIQIHIIPTENTLVLKTDEHFITRILDNLISNALKFSYPKQNVYINWQDAGNQMIISIKDEGQGISPEEQSQLFKKFQKLSARPTAGEDSTGLGLAIVKTLVEKLKGGISVKSTLNQGAEFIVSLPKDFQITN